MLNHRRLLNRQLVPSLTTSVAGVSGEITAGTAVGTAFEVDSSTAGIVEATDAPAFASVVPVITQSTNDSPSPTAAASTPSDSPTAAASSASSNSGISMGTVVGACVGALAGAIFLILCAYLYYRRTVNAVKKQRVTRGRTKGDDFHRLHSRGEDDQDKWDGMGYAKSRELLSTSTPTEDLFKASSTNTHSSEKTTTTELPPLLSFGNHPFANSPTVARQNEFESQQNKVDAIERDFSSSWHEDASSDSSFATLRHHHMSQRAMSPNVNSALRTPTVTSSEPHLWESAEVVQMEHHQSSYDEEMEVDELHRRKSANNPFFSSRDRDYMATHKGKHRASNPFESPSDTESVVSNETLRQHISMASDASNDRALQSLIAVLDASPKMPVLQDARSIRPPSTQASFTSVYASAEDGDEGDDMDVSSSFPLPPHNH